MKITTFACPLSPYLPCASYPVTAFLQLPIKVILPVKIGPSPGELLEEAKIKLLSSGKEHSFKDQYDSLVARQTEIIKELC